MPKVLKQGPGGECPPSKGFVEEVAKVLMHKKLHNLLRKKAVGIDLVNVAQATVYMWRACLAPHEVNEENFLAALWLAVKYSEHPSCSDTVFEWISKNERQLPHELDDEACGHRFSSKALLLWKRAAMRTIVPQHEIDTTTALLKHHIKDSLLYERQASLPRMWTAMRSWVGIPTKQIYKPRGKQEPVKTV
eukprot:TRINITY_DN2242_c0_g2_i1.p1 TRINITY_DN2242_c0_g2~~TRINITY_DN2242_c0_g2_i1.p1  ORF type:complete len:191 (+),score=35.67 TRINITY_DN2242_c0_g2_i1:52-624(+)